jgi:beta-glucosidase-like glycosyl hydrolase
MRLEDGTDFPHAMALGKTGEFTGKVAKAIAKEAKDLGVLWNLAQFVILIQILKILYKYSCFR